jgi:hypothetical protein
VSQGGSSRGIPVPAALGGVVLAFGVGLACNGLRDSGREPARVERPSGALAVVTRPQGTATPSLEAPKSVRPASTRAPRGPVAAPDVATPAPADAPVEPAQLPPYDPPSLGSGRHGEGELIAFYEPFKTPEEKARWEDARRQRWEKRLARENEVTIDLMKDKLGIDEQQATAVRKILADRLAARMALIAKLNSGEIGRVDMEDHVLAIKSRALAGLKATLTPAQYEGYFQLDPRQQVLNEEAHAPK